MSTVYVQLEGVSTASGDLTPVRIVGIDGTGSAGVAVVSRADDASTMPAQLIAYGHAHNGGTLAAEVSGLIPGVKFYAKGVIAASTPLYVQNGGGLGLNPGTIPQVVAYCVGGVDASDVMAQAQQTNGSGVVGLGILSTVGAPGPGDGVDGDFCISSANNVYGPKASGVWPAGTSMIGPTGAVGPAGPAGTMPATVTINTQITGYGLLAADANKVVLMTSAVAAVLNVPLNATTPISVGFTCKVIQSGAGAITVTPEVGVTVKTVAAGLATTGAGAVVELLKTATNTWVVSGNLA